MKPFALHPPSIITALEEVLKMPTTLTPKCRADIKGSLTYLKSFSCVLMSAIWTKILGLIDDRNVIIQVLHLVTVLKVNYNFTYNKSKLLFHYHYYDYRLLCNLIIESIN